MELNGGVWEDWGLEFDVIGTEGLVDGLVGLDVDGLVDGCIEVLLGPGVFGVVTLLKQLPDIVPESNLFFFSTYHVHITKARSASFTPKVCSTKKKYFR